MYLELELRLFLVIVVVLHRMPILPLTIWNGLRNINQCQPNKLNLKKKSFKVHFESWNIPSSWGCVCTKARAHPGSSLWHEFSPSWLCASWAKAPNLSILEPLASSTAPGPSEHSSTLICPSRIYKGLQKGFIPLLPLMYWLWQSRELCQENSETEL